MKGLYYICDKIADKRTTGFMEFENDCVAVKGFIEFLDTPVMERGQEKLDKDGKKVYWNKAEFDLWRLTELHDDDTITGRPTECICTGLNAETVYERLRSEILEDN